MNIVLIRGQLVKNTSGMKMLLLASKQSCLFDNQVRKNLTLFSFENWQQHFLSLISSEQIQKL